jgi:hypothetical protein
MCRAPGANLIVMDVEGVDGAEKADNKASGYQTLVLPFSDHILDFREKILHIFARIL